jgi:hypothetical protein
MHLRANGILCDSNKGLFYFWVILGLGNEYWIENYVPFKLRLIFDYYINWMENICWIFFLGE